jgi:hypothetical protein
VVAAVALAHAQDGVSVLSARGKRHYLKVAAIPASNRVNRGERLVDFGSDDKIAAAVSIE